MIIDNSILLCAPLSPTQNVRDRQHWSTKNKYRNLAYSILRDQIRRLAGGGYTQPIWNKVILEFVRCSMGTVMADTANIIGGLKSIIDVLQCSRTVQMRKTGNLRDYPGIGLFKEDSPKYVTLGSIEDRPRGHWKDLPGPGTWVKVIPL